MAIHDYNIANQSFPATRSDINNALAAAVSNNSSATAPTTTTAYMFWADTANDVLKQRNAADNAWINVLTLSTGVPSAGAGASGGGTNKAFWENDQNVTDSYSITTNTHASTVGPITVDAGVVVTVPSGSNWVVL
jgi:hypothetical protein